MTPSEQGALDFDGDPDGDARGRAPKAKRRKAGPPPVPGTFYNCARGEHRICAREVLVNATQVVERCACPCHGGSS